MEHGYEQRGLGDLPRRWAFATRPQRMNVILYGLATLSLLATLGELTVGRPDGNDRRVLAVAGPAASSSTVAPVTVTTDPVPTSLFIPAAPPPPAPGPSSGGKAPDPKDPKEPKPSTTVPPVTTTTEDTLPPFMGPFPTEPSTTSTTEESTTTTKKKSTTTTTKKKSEASGQSELDIPKPFES